MPEYSNTIKHDLFCRKCNFNLKSKDKDGVCPVCDQPIAENYLLLIRSLQSKNAEHGVMYNRSLVNVAACSRLSLEDVHLVYQCFNLTVKLRTNPNDHQLHMDNLIHQISFEQLLDALTDVFYVLYGNEYHEALTEHGLANENTIRYLLTLMAIANIIPTKSQLAKDIGFDAMIVPNNHPLLRLQESSQASIHELRCVYH